jgi:sulfate adenylyltransferase subunit 1 (EFTu-like GTPase family)
MNNHSVLLVCRQLQIKNTMEYHHILATMLNIKMLLLNVSYLEELEFLSTIVKKLKYHFRKWFSIFQKLCI